MKTLTNDNGTRIEQYMDVTGYFPDEVVGATEEECEESIRQTEGYCTNPRAEQCIKCSLCNYGRDCHNNAVAQA